MFLLFLIPIVCGILIVFIKYSLWRHQYSLGMPGPRENFLNPLGKMTDFMLMHWTAPRQNTLHQNIFKFLTDSFNQYGSKSLYCLWIGYHPFVILSKADAVKELLKGNTFPDKSSFYDITKLLVGSGLVTSSAAKWKPRRKMLNPCFHNEILKGFQPVFDKHAQKLAIYFEAETKNEFTYIDIPLKLSALDMACETIFGVSMRAMENKESEYIKAICRLGELIMIKFFCIWLWPDFIFKCTSYHKEFFLCMKIVQDFTSSVIQKKKESYIRGGDSNDKRQRKALMDVLLDRHFKFQDLSEEDIREEANTFILTGHETTAISTKWTLFLIGHHPDVQSKIHEELDRTLGKDVDAPIAENDLNSLDYLECVIKEANRIYPILPQYGRKTDEDANICGYTIPKGASCFVFSYYVHRDETVFPDPEKFDPDRFLPENEINIPEFAYIPFSAGPRNCIGKTFAMMEMKTTLAAILRRFEIHSLDGRDKVQPLFQISLNPSIPIRVRFRCRQ